MERRWSALERVVLFPFEVLGALLLGVPVAIFLALACTALIYFLLFRQLGRDLSRWVRPQKADSSRSPGQGLQVQTLKPGVPAKKQPNKQELEELARITKSVEISNMVARARGRATRPS